jgi:hypothetical protein
MQRLKQRADAAGARAKPSREDAATRSLCSRRGRRRTLQAFSGGIFCAIRRCSRMYIISPPKLITVSGIPKSAMANSIRFSGSWREFLIEPANDARPVWTARPLRHVVTTWGGSE